MARGFAYACQCMCVQLYKWRPETLSQALPFLVETVSLPGPELTELANLTIQAVPLPQDPPVPASPMLE